MEKNDLIKKIKEKKSLSGLSDQIITKELESYLKREKINLSLNDLLNSHSSTRERKDFYQTLKNKISDLDVKSILDLGCGLNPIAIAEQGIVYNAYDINQDNLNEVDKYFKENNISGQVKVADLRENNEFPKADLAILFKVLDLIDEKNHKPSEMLLKSLDSKYLLISFSTKTLSGAPMRHPQRGWIELLLNRLGYEFESFSSKNEIFYLAKKGMSSS
jgi:hypothetical protein